MTTPRLYPRTRTLLLTVTLWLVFFAVAKAVFAVVCRGDELLSVPDVLCALWHGLPLDLSTTGYLTVPVLLLLWLSVEWPSLPLRRVLTPLYALLSAVASAAVVLDASLYPFWHFKLDATILGYADTTAGITASVPVSFIVVRLIVWLCATVLMVWLLSRCTVPCAGAKGHANRLHHLSFAATATMLFVVIRGGVGDGTMNVGTAYHSQRLYLNHVAVNPVFSFLASTVRADDYAAQFNLLPEDERERTFNDLYPVLPDDTVSPVKARPNVLIVLWESCGSPFFTPLGGRAGVTPGLERLAAEGLYFSRFYCNSYRTDRALVSALSGWFSYPTLTLMRLPVVTDRLPCLGNSFAREGYSTFFLYGGDISFTHMGGYIVGGGFQTVVSDRDFSAAERHSESWGVTDSIAFDRLHDMVVQHQRAERPWMGAMLTLSSHEPFKVPYSRLADDIDNSVAYTDHCLTRLMDKLKQDSALWDNTLVVVLPDHGMRMRTPLASDALFHAPMVWTGGALLQPGCVERFMNQSDLAATLLASVGLPHDDFRWSRNVLSPEYSYPFAYCTSSDGVFFADSTGWSTFDVQAMLPLVTTSPQGDSLRQHRAKAILQTSYDIVSETINTASR